MAMVAAGAAAYAQKPAAGDYTLETQLNFQTGTAPISLFTPNVRARYFLSEDMAARVEFLFASSSETNTFGENPDGTGATGEQKIKSSQFTFAPGIEKHLAGTDKLSPYFGASLPLTFLGASEEWTDFNGGGYQKDAKGTIEGGNSNGDVAGMSIGVNLIFGADYYFTDAIYIGGEFAWGWAMASTKDETTKVTIPPGAEATTVNLGGKSSGFGIATSAVRLGVKF